MLHVAAVLLYPALVVPSPMQEDGWLNSPPPAEEFGDRDRHPTYLLVDFPQWSVGLGVDVYTGFGSVFNDVVGPAIRGSYRLDPR